MSTARINYRNWAVDASGDVVGSTDVEIRHLYSGDLVSAASIYTDETGSAAKATNPFAADADGSFSVWLAPGGYTVTLGAGASQTTQSVYLVPSDVAFTTRALLVSTIAAGAAWPDGTLISDGTVTYKASAGATAIADLPGLVPYGDPTPQHWGALGDGVTDDAAAFLAWVAYLDANSLHGHIPSGTYAVSYVRNRTMTGNVSITADPGAVIKGMTTKATVAGDDAITSYTVTEYTAGNDGFVVVYVSGGVSTVWTAGTQYTVSGQTINWGAGSSPHGALATGDSIVIVSADPILELGQDTATFQNRISWRGGKIDNSLRGYAPESASGTGIDLFNFEKVLVEDVVFQGAADHEAALANHVADSGLTTTVCNQVVVTGCDFIGQADLGVYVTGGASTSGTDDGQHVSIHGNYFYACQQGVSAKREVRGVKIYGNTFDRCFVGATLYDTSSANGGGRGVIYGNTFQKCGKRAIDVRRTYGFSVNGNAIVDTGYKLDGTAEVADVRVIDILGASDGQVYGNTIRYDEFTVPTATATYAVQLSQDVTLSPTLQSSNVIVQDNNILGFVNGIREGGSGTGNVFRENNMPGVTTAYSVPSARRWHYRKSNVEYSGIGSSAFKGSWTPGLVMAGGSPTLTYLTQYGRYVRQGDIVWVFCELLVTVTHALTTNELRVSGLPYTAYNNADQKGSGAVVYKEQLSLPSGYIDLVPEIPGGQSYVRFRAMEEGTGMGQYLQASAVASGTNLRVDFSCFYEVEPESQN